MAKKPRYYYKQNTVYDREWFPPIGDRPPPPFTLAHCRNIKVARILAMTLNSQTVLDVERTEAATAKAWDD